MEKGLLFDITNYSSVFILTDENIAPFWLPEVCEWLHCPDAIEIIIKPGEQQKNLQTIQEIWNKLLKHNADRHSLLVNLGGGVISDMGGFAASCFKRGIDFINIPTTLLSMVDASIGGKTGIDFGGYKNQIGVFAEAKDVLVNPVFLSTLPKREILSGLAEMLKYGFIADSDLLQVGLDNYQSYISRAAEIKKTIVAEDPFEQGRRKILNFGHTIGHAVESYCLTKENPLLHGEAVAIGMWCALWLSVHEFGLDTSVLQDFESKLPMLLDEAQFVVDEQEIPEIMEKLVHDKKTQNGKPQFVLLETVGEPVVDVEVEPDMICESLLQFRNLLF